MYPSLLNRAWKDRVLELASNALIIPSTRAQPATANLISVMVTSVNADADANQDEMRFKRSVKDLYVRPVHASSSRDCRDGDVLVGKSTSTPAETMNTDKSPQEMVESCITALQAVHETEGSWRGVVKGGDPDNFCTKNEIFKIRQQALFLSMAYQLALQKINQWTWYNCCKETCSRLNDLGI